jgi:molybdopterin molybdotransferase
MTPVDQALSAVLAELKCLASETVSLDQAHGRVLGTDACAVLNYPPSDMSAMDGYAVIASDTRDCPATLRQIGESQAGNRFHGEVASGQTVRIFTGAPLPRGANAVVMQENVTADGDQITINEPVSPDHFIRPLGMDYKAGDCLLKAGSRITARAVGLLASANVTQVNVVRRPKIAYLATGDELVMPGQQIGPDQIISSNSIALDAYIRAFGGEPYNLGIARDTPQSLREALSRLDDSDFLVTIGGASVGDYDLVRQVLGEEGLEMSFYRVAMRPGKPLISGKIAGIPLLGLPGNPVSAGITALLFLRPAIERMLGLNVTTELVMQAELGCDLGPNDKRQDYLRAELSRDSAQKLIAMPYSKQDSAMMANFTRADCLIIRPPDITAAQKGDTIDIVILALGCETY